MNRAFTDGEAPRPPVAVEISAVRQYAGLSVEQAAKLVHRQAEDWLQWEMGQAQMDSALWELDSLKIAQIGASAFKEHSL